MSTPDRKVDFEPADRLRTAHDQLEHTVTMLKVHLSVARLTSHANSLTEERFAEAAAEYDDAQRHLDSFATSLERAYELRARPSKTPAAGRRSRRARKSGRAY